MIIPLALLAVLAAAAHAQAPRPQTPDQYRATANRIIDAALADSSAYRRLATMVDKFGHRFSGSASLELSIDWILEQMRADRLDNVRGENVMVPRWVRGRESASLVQPRALALPMLGLGGSIGTPPGGITAEVLVVSTFDELRAKAQQARGKIILWDAPFTTYGETVVYRRTGAIEAAKVGAVASLIRSVASYSMKTPHTGSLAYDSAVTRIPAAALTVEDAQMLHRMQDRGERPVIRLEMSAQTLPPTLSRNVVAELRGSERPDEVVVIGGHIDSWDVGQGAMDDGGGSFVTWEALRVLQRLGLRPRRTIRVVMWTNEENGLAGGNAYRDRHRATLDKHVLAMESDGGVFAPTGFGFTGSDSARAIVRQVGALLERISASSIESSGGGADIGPIMALGVPGMAALVDQSKYFWYHHTEADTIDKLDPREMAMCVAAIAVMAYVIADLPQALPR